MKNKRSKLLLSLCLVVLLPLSLILTGVFLPHYYAETYYAELAPMLQRIHEADGKRLIVLGNSDVAFGLNGALMEQLLSDKGYDYRVCPFGLYAAVGAGAMLELSRDELRDGDLVVFVVEPVSETLSSYFGANAFWKCAEDTPQLLFRVNSSQRTALLGSYTGYLQERYAYFRDGTAPPVQGVYAKASFDERCDMIFNRPGNTMAIGYDTAEPIDFSSLSVEESFSKQVADYCSAAAKSGAAVCISFSPMNRSAIADISAVSRHFTRINTAFSCPVISNPNDYILDSGWFYDSNFHLNSAGAVVRTVTLTCDVLAYLGCYQAVDYELPTMPASATKPMENAGDTDSFTYAPIGDGNGWLISGLTEQGQIHKVLSVSSSYEGTPVVGFTADALSQAANLEELTLPASIETLPDYLFASCSKLTRLILQHTDAPCGVSAHSFDHADQVRIFVPSAAYPFYRDGYGCETNPWSSLLNRVFTY